MNPEKVIRDMFSRFREQFPTEEIEDIHRYCFISHMAMDYDPESHFPQAEIARYRLARLVYRHNLQVYREVCEELDRQFHHRFMVVKGLVQACDLYPHPEQRQVSDIDLLVRPQDAEELFAVLDSMGFDCQFDREYRRIHILKDHVYFLKKVKNVEVKIEVHASAFNPVSHYPTYLEKLFERAVTFQDADFLVPGLYDRVIYAMLHFAIHLSDSWLEVMTGSWKTRFPLKELLDTALLIDKYGASFDTETLAAYVREIAACTDFAAAWKLFALVFPEYADERLTEPAVLPPDETLIFTNTRFMVDMLRDCDSARSLFGHGLEVQLQSCADRIFRQTEPVDGHAIRTGDFDAVVRLNGDTLEVHCDFHTDRAPAAQTRCKLYYLSNSIPVFAMIRLEPKPDGLDIKTIGAAPAVLWARHEMVDEHRWTLDFAIPAGNIRMADGCAYLNLLQEYSILTQLCLFGSRWTELNAWQPVRIEE